MKSISSIGVALLALAVSASGSPVPAADPLDVDLCGLAGLDLDLTPQASIEGEFKMIGQKDDFTGRSLYVGKSTRPGALPALLALEDVQHAYTFTLKDNVLETSGKPVGFCALNYAVVNCFKLNAKIGIKLGTYQARHICDPVTKEAVRIIEIAPSTTAKYPHYDGFSDTGTKDNRNPLIVKNDLPTGPVKAGNNRRLLFRVEQ